MVLASKRIIKNLLKKYNIYPSKRLGQNFLVDEGVFKKIIEAANLLKDDIVLEVGPGIGNLTLELAKRVKKVIAIEKDSGMIEVLRINLKNFKNVEILKGDALKIIGHKLSATASILWPRYKVVANIPYYLTSPLIRKFLEAKNQPKEMILMVQKEVAQRICARPPKMSILAVSVQFYSKPEIISFVSKKSFWPSPKVDSAIIKISALNQRKKSAFNQRFFKIVKAGFSQPRKQLVNNLSEKLKIEKKKIREWLLKNNIQPAQRAETLKIENWINLTKNYKIK